jgi:PhoPQ-activated pathogenicity-related protein
METALDRYAARLDASYSWTLAKTIPGSGWTAYVIDLTSQTWRSPAEVDRNVWKHWLTVVEPAGVATSTALLFIGGGDNGREMPVEASPRLTSVAVAQRAIVAELGQVPNQPLVFADGQSRWEDDLIAHTWNRHMASGDETWPARLPMTKSALRAMDAVQAFFERRGASEVNVERFVLAGSSSRGWTTWLTAAIDDRVRAIVPIVTDVPSFEASLTHQHAAYGEWSPAIGDYERSGILGKLGSIELGRLLAIEDPIAYRDRLGLPKLIINSSGDEFSLPDSSRFYLDDLPGETLVRCVPNAKRNLAGSDALQTVEAYFRWIVEGKQRPEIRSELAADGSLVVHAGGAPADAGPPEVLLWQATNPAARDFRLDVLGRVWTSSPVAESGGTDRSSVRVPPPAAGWTAYFVELTYRGSGPIPLKVTTRVYVTPDTLPHA